jgi:hypothetical protein
MVLRSLVIIQRWLSKAAKWDDFKVINVGGHVVDLVATLKDSRNTHIPLQNGQATDLESVLRIVLEGEKPFDAELVTQAWLWTHLRIFKPRWWLRLAALPPYLCYGDASPVLSWHVPS